MTFNRLIWLLLFLFLYSCKNSSNVVSHSVFQKRKYQRGWHIDGRRSIKHDCQAKEVGPATAQLLIADTLEKFTSDSVIETHQEVSTTPVVEVINELVTTSSRNIFSSNKSIDQPAFGLKKKMKRRKEKFTKETRSAQLVTILSTWGYDWPFYKSFIGITLSAIGLLLTIYSLTKLRKNQKRNKRFCYFLIFVNLFYIVFFGIIVASTPP